MKVEELLLLPPTAVFTVVLPLTYKGLQSVTRDANCTLMLKSDFFEPLSLWFVLKPSTLVVHVKTGILLKLQACLGLIRGNQHWTQLMLSLQVEGLVPKPHLPQSLS